MILSSHIGPIAVRRTIMTSGEKIGAALAKAVKSAAAEWKKGEQAPVMYRTNLRDVPKVDGLKCDDGWVDMQVQFLIDKKSTGANHVVGWTVLKPGARHVNHRHHNCDEFWTTRLRPTRPSRVALGEF